MNRLQQEFLDRLADGSLQVNYLEVMPNAQNVTFLTQTPHIHLHYLTGSDEVADAQGYAMIELCCHGCGTAIGIKCYIPPDGGEDPELVALRETFQKWHKDCPSDPLYKANCPEQDIYPKCSLINLLERESQWGFGSGMLPGVPNPHNTTMARFARSLGSSETSDG